MGDRGQTSVPLTAETTEWDEILIKKGVLSRDEILRNKGVDPDEVRLEEELEKLKEAHYENLRNQTFEDKMEEKNLSELEDLEDEYADEDEEEILQKIRQKRLDELRAKAARARFGEVYEISKADWIAEVTNASESAFVIAHLYQDSVIECKIMEESLKILASKFREVKFVRIRSTQAIENWPEQNLPALFIYSKGKLTSQLVGLKELGGVRMKPEDLEWYLAKLGIIETELEGNPRDGVGANAINIRRTKSSEDEYDSD